MWTDVVVLSEPLVDDDLCLLCCGEPFGVKHLVAQGAEGVGVGVYRQSL